MKKPAMLKDFARDLRGMVSLPTRNLGKVNIGGRRVVLAATLIIASHVFFYISCTLLKQPYESVWVRAIMISLTIPALFWRELREFAPTRANLIYQVIIFANLAVFSPWMYFLNQTALWLSCMCSGLVMYFVMSDWRTSLLMSVPGCILAWLMASIVTTNIAVSPSEVLAIGFALTCGVWLSYIVQSKNNDMAVNSNIALGLMAHELRTPLQSIELLAETMLHGDSKDHKDLLIRILFAARRTQNMVDEQVESARLSPKGWTPEQFSAQEILNQVRSDYIANLSSSSIDITIEITSDFLINGSKNQLRRVITNLIKNAHQSIHSSKKHGAILIEVKTTGDLGEIYVSDNGPGIVADDIRNIFQAFYTTHPGTRRGLGLYHAKHIIEDVMQGKITARTSNTGATVLVRLPLRQVESQLDEKSDLGFLDSV